MSQFSWHVVAAGTEGPGPRSRHGLVYDQATQTTVLFGGILWEDPVRLLSDTWELHNGRWSVVQGPTSPRARHRGGMVYDPVRSCAVLFGGQDSRNSMLNDTWFYGDHSWRPWRS